MEELCQQQVGLKNASLYCAFTAFVGKRLINNGAGEGNRALASGWEGQGCQANHGFF
jgi:hypothetical protein